MAFIKTINKVHEVSHINADNIKNNILTKYVLSRNDLLSFSEKPEDWMSLHNHFVKKTTF